MPKLGFFVPVAFWGAALFAVRLVAVPAESCSDLSAVEARASAQAAADWLIAGQRGDGSYVYEYNRDEDSFPSEYNIVRHAGVTMSLYQVAGRLGDEEAMATAELGLAWMLERLESYNDWRALTDVGEGKLGSTALMTIAMAERRLITGDTQYDQVMRQLGRFMVALQREDGGFHTKWYFNSNEPEVNETSLYYPGEALWAIALLHEAFPDDGWDDAAFAAADFITLIRDELENVEFPPLNDHWGAYGLAEMAEWGLEDHHTNYARRLAGRFSFLIRTEAQKDANPGADASRGPDRRAASLGTWVEGMAALWRLSQDDERLSDLASGIEDRARCGAGILHKRQAESVNPLIDGAWFVEGLTRMDDQQHAISGLIYTGDALDDRSRREPDR
ncbi:MAG: hypothetical protein WEB00_00800 [Dehalococcoidia bacterium]